MSSGPQHVGDSLAVQIAKAALLEAGHPELATEVEANRIGIPIIRSHESHRAHRSVIARAFMLGHQAAGHDAWLGRGINGDFEWVDSVECADCWDGMRHAG